MDRFVTRVPVSQTTLSSTSSSRSKSIRYTSLVQSDATFPPPNPRSDGKVLDTAPESDGNAAKIQVS